MNMTSPTPKLARYTSEGAIVKDHHYYSSNDFSWNKPAKVNAKNYQYFHKQNDLNKERLAEMIKQEKEEKQVIEEYRKKYLIKLKAEDRARYTEKVRERNVIQAKSCQKLGCSIDQSLESPSNREVFNIVAKKLNSMKFARSNEVSWNFFDKSSKKRIRQTILTSTLKREEEMLEKVKQRIAKEEEVQQEIDQRREQIRVKLREKMLTRHDANLTFEEKVGTMITKNMTTTQPRTSLILSSDLTPISPILLRGGSNVSIDQFSEMSPVPQFRVRFPSIVGSLQRADSEMFSLQKKLSKSKSMASNELQKTLHVAQTELKGLLINNMERGIYNSENLFHKRLTDNSPVFRKIAEDNAKDKHSTNTLRRNLSILKANYVSATPTEITESSTSGNRNKSSPQKTKKHVSPLKKIDEKQFVYGELKDFDRRYGTTIKHKGYSKTALEEANRICADIGLVTPLEISMHSRVTK